MKTAKSTKSDRPTTTAARSFFQTDKENAAHDGSEISAQRPKFFRATPASARNEGAPAVQAKCSECDAEEREQQTEQDGSDSVEVQRTPAFESGDDGEVEAEGTVQRQAAPVARIGADEQASLFFPAVQARLTVGRPDDPLERVADAVAERVVRGEAPGVQSKDGHPDAPSLFTSTLLDKHIGHDAAPTSGGLEQRLQSSKGQGAPLSKPTRGRMESAFGADFEDVRVHTGADAAGMNSALGAQAFTHGSDIYFNEGKYNPDTKEGESLLAHELTHTIQQGSADRASPQQIQPKLSEHERPEFGDTSQQRLDAEIDEEVDEDKKEEAQDPERREELLDVDPGEKSSKKTEMKKPAAPDVNQAEVEKPKIEEEKKEGDEKIDNPEELVEEGETEEVEEPVVAEQTQISEALALSEAALARSRSIPDPEAPPEVVAPEPFEHLDAAGDPIKPDPEGDKYLYEVAQKAQDLRGKGLQTRAGAIEKEREGEVLEAKWELTRSGVAESDRTLDTVDEALRVRRETATQSEEALRVSQEKQRTVEEQAPTFLNNAKEAKADSATVAEESQDKKRENEANRPEDPDDRADAEEQGSQLTDVADKGSQVDDTFGQAQENIQSLITRNAEAKEKNIRSAESIAIIHGQLDQADAKAAELRSSNQAAKAELAAHAAEPREVKQQARAMHAAGEQIQVDSEQMENDLLLAQVKYRNDLRAIPGVVIEEEAAGAEEGLLQLKPENDYANRIDIFRDTFLDPETYRSVEEREAAVQKATEARRTEIERIENFYDKPFSEYTRWEKIKAGIGAKISRFTDWISQLTFADVIKGAGKLLLDVFNPLTYLKGIGHGFKMVINGLVNLAFDIWNLDFWGVIKSMADIATGIAVVAGTITALALVVAAAMVALILITWGLASPVAVPVMTAMGVVMKFAGTVAVWSGLAAAALNGIAGVKSLVDMGDAENAEQLQAETDDLQQDVGGAATGLLMAAVGRAGMIMGPTMKATGLAVTLGTLIAGPKAMAGIILADLGAGIIATLTLRRFRGWLRGLFRRRKKGVVPPEKKGAVPPEKGAVPPEKGAVPPEKGAVPPEKGAVPPEKGAVPPGSLGKGDFFQAHVSGEFGVMAELDSGGMLNLYIKKGPGTPRGGQMFNEAMRAFGSNVKGVRGTWLGGGGLADNFNAFKAAIRDGLTPEQAAFSTFTGHMAKKQGFKTAKVVTNNSSKVVVEFTP